MSPPLPQEFKSLLPPYTGYHSKIEILDSDTYSTDKTMLTIVFHQEDHTIGNVLKEIICKMKGVEFCGYNVPHPLEDKILFRIQTRDGYVAGDILMQALDDLEKIFESTEQKFESAYRQFGSG